MFNNQELNSLLALFEGNGWECVGRTQDVMCFVKSYGSDRFGNVLFNARVFTKGYSECREFVGCRLCGPVLNGRTGAYSPNVTLGEWKTVSGTMSGVLQKTEMAYKDYYSKERSLSRKRELCVNFSRLQRVTA